MAAKGVALLAPARLGQRGTATEPALLEHRYRICARSRV